MMIESGPEVGLKRMTASSVVGDSGKPQALYGYAFHSGPTAGVLVWFDGTSSLGTPIFQHKGLINSTVIMPLNGGWVFPNGLFASFDANISQVVAFHRQTRTS